MKSKVQLYLFSAACCGMTAIAAEPAANPLPDTWKTALVEPAQVPQWHRAEVSRVHLDGEWGRRMQITSQYIARTDLAKMLGQLGQGKHGNMYLGLGKFLDATTRFAAYEPVLRPQRDALVTGLLAAQDTTGYIGGWQAGPPLTTHGQWEVHELTYLIVGLCADHRLTGDSRSLDAARRAGDYLMTYLKPLREHCAQGLIGLDLALGALDERTGDPKYREFLLKEVAPIRWQPHDRAPFDHFYEYQAICVGQLEFCARHSDPQLLLRSHRLLEFLEGGGLLVTGGSSNHEKTDLSHASNVTVETCSTAYLVRSMARLFEITGDVRCAEIIERAVNNALFAAQTPDGRTIFYFTEHEGKGRNGPYVCCQMNFLRAISELPELVAYGRPGGLAICQYVPGTYDIALGIGHRVKLTIATAYPDDGLVRIRVAPSRPGRFTLQVRVPAWCEKPTVEVAAQPVADVKPGAWAMIDREWRDGDEVVLRLPMDWRWVPGKAKQLGKSALMRGPLVWRLAPARSQLAGIDLDALVPEINDGVKLEPDAAWRPDGRIVRLRTAQPGTAELVFTTYPDPAGTKVWFHLPSRSAGK